MKDKKLRKALFEGGITDSMIDPDALKNFSAEIATIREIVRNQRDAMMQRIADTNRHAENLVLALSDLVDRLEDRIDRIEEDIEIILDVLNVEITRDAVVVVEREDEEEEETLS